MAFIKTWNEIDRKYVNGLQENQCPSCDEMSVNIKHGSFDYGSTINFLESVKSQN